MPSAKTADICLLLEGTYPYVQGGVSVWVHQMITLLAEYKFSLVFIGSSPDDYKGLQFELPPNVVDLQTHYLSRGTLRKQVRLARGTNDFFSLLKGFHGKLLQHVSGGSSDALDRMLTSLGSREGISRKEFLFSSNSWEYLREKYLSNCPQASFLDYFWTIRAMHGPLFTLAAIAQKAPPARLYHAVSTGYAGILGVFIAQRKKRPFILTEHGIYTKEREIELSQAEWIHDSIQADAAGLGDDSSHVRNLWINFFRGLGQLAYNTADSIITLNEGNRQRQIRYGSPEERTRIIPNGTNLARFEPVLKRRPSQIPQVIGFMGRLVPIKDLKTFIRAMSTVCQKLPAAEAWIIGSAEENPFYAQECVDLVLSLGLKEKVKFLGHRDVTTVLHELGLVVLSSISESQPLSILEAFASGVPVVTTDVGSCREQIEGRLPEDRALGSAGVVVPIGNPEAFARGILSLLSDPDRWQAAQQAALKRVRRYYDEQLMVKEYRGIYQQTLEASA